MNQSEAPKWGNFSIFWYFFRSLWSLPNMKVTEDSSVIQNYLIFHKISWTVTLTWIFGIGITDCQPVLNLLSLSSERLNCIQMFEVGLQVRYKNLSNFNWKYLGIVQFFRRSVSCKPNSQIPIWWYSLRSMRWHFYGRCSNSFRLASWTSENGSSLGPSQW